MSFWILQGKVATFYRWGEKTTRCWYKIFSGFHVIKID